MLKKGMNKLLAKGLVAIAVDNYKLVIECLEQLSIADINVLLHEVFLTGQKKYGEGKFINALKCFEIIVDNSSKKSGEIYCDSGYCLGCMYSNALGVKENKELAITYFHKSSLAGHANSTYNLACIKYNQKKYDESFVLFEKLATGEKVHALSQKMLAKQYEGGLGVEQNNELAFSWYSKAAQNKDHESLLKKSYMLSEGIGVEKNIQEASICGDEADQYERQEFETGQAANKSILNLKKYQFILDSIKFLNKNQKKDLSSTLFEQVFIEQFLRALHKSVEANRKLPASKKAVTVQQCFSYLEEEANISREVELLHFIASCYHYHFEDAIDINKAILWYKKAALKENKDSFYVLGFLYSRFCSHDCIKKDEDLSLYYYQKAMLLGHTLAAYNLMYMYRTLSKWEYVESIAKYLKEKGEVLTEKYLEEVSDNAEKQRSKLRIR